MHYTAYYGRTTPTHYTTYHVAGHERQAGEGHTTYLLLTILLTYYLQYYLPWQDSSAKQARAVATEEKLGAEKLAWEEAAREEAQILNPIPNPNPNPANPNPDPNPDPNPNLPP